jgi:hypothetical protein
MLPFFLWWLAIQVIGLAALPLAWRLLRRLPGRGYAFAKPLGLLLVCYLLWLGASFRVLPNDLGASWWRSSRWRFSPHGWGGRGWCATRRADGRC